MNTFVHTPYTVNGHFLCRNLTGIERFSIEVLKEMDKIVPQGFLSLLIPANSPFIPDFKNIQIIQSSKNLTSYWKWTQFTFCNFTRKYKTTGINFANECPVFNPGLAFLHDIYCKLYPQDLKSIKEKLIKTYSCFLYKYISKHCKHIFTVSEFSKNQILKTYKINSDKVSVIPNGWDHFKSISADDSIFNKFPQLKKGHYYFTLGSLQKRKNLKWILDYATKHPAEQFAISGKVINGMESNELSQLKNLPNVILLGYLSDENVKALMQNCKAFIFPSYYEGFGIPPLEALSVGATIVIAKAACLPEIYKESAIYIDPFNTDCNLDELIAESAESCKSHAQSILNEYTYDKAAKKLYNVLINLKAE